MDGFFLSDNAFGEALFHLDLMRMGLLPGALVTMRAESLRREVDELVVLETPADFAAVGAEWPALFSSR